MFMQEMKIRLINYPIKNKNLNDNFLFFFFFYKTLFLFRKLLKNYK